MHLLVGVSRHCPHSHRDKSRRDSRISCTHTYHMHMASPALCDGRWLTVWLSLQTASHALFL